MGSFALLCELCVSFVVKKSKTNLKTFPFSTGSLIFVTLPFLWTILTLLFASFWTGFEISSFHGNQWLFLFKVTSLMMVYDIFWSLFVAVTFAQDNRGYCYRNIMDNNALGFEYSFAIRSCITKKTHNFFNSLNKTYSVISNSTP